MKSTGNTTNVIQFLSLYMHISFYISISLYTYRAIDIYIHLSPHSFPLLPPLSHEAIDFVITLKLVIHQLLSHKGHFLQIVSPSFGQGPSDSDVIPLGGGDVSVTPPAPTSPLPHPNIPTQPTTPPFSLQV